MLAGAGGGLTVIDIRPASEFQSGEPGLYADVPMEVYAKAHGVSNSALTIIDQHNEAKLLWEREHPKESTAAQRFGQYAHACILEPERFEREFDKAGQCEGVTGGGSRCRNVGSARIGGRWYCGIHVKKVDGTPDEITSLSDGDYADLMGMTEAIYAHPEISRIMALPSHRELSGLWIDEATGLLCKMRIDLLAYEHGAIFDYKTIGTSVKEEDISWAIWKHGYMRQAPMYLSGCKALGLPIEDFGFIFQEKTGPYFCRAFRLDDAALRVGVSQLRGLMRRYKRCKETNEWPGYNDGTILPVGLPDKVIKYDLADGERSAIYQGEVTLT